MTDQPITFKAQIAPIQSGMLIGPDGVMLKLIPLELDGELIAKLYNLQETSFMLTALDVMGDITVNASIPDTKSAMAINKKTPHVQILIPKADSLTAFRFYALYNRAFDVRITRENGKAPTPAPAESKKKKAEPKLSGPFGLYWRQMVKGNYFVVPGVADALGCEATEEATATALRELFIVNTRADIAPVELEAWAHKNSLDSLITLSKNALVKSQEQAG